jgi:hypothetical protein
MISPKTEESQQVPRKHTHIYLRLASLLKGVDINFTNWSVESEPLAEFEEPPPPFDAPELCRGTSNRTGDEYRSAIVAVMSTSQERESDLLLPAHPEVSVNDRHPISVTTVQLTTYAANRAFPNNVQMQKKKSDGKKGNGFVDVENKEKGFNNTNFPSKSLLLG